MVKVAQVLEASASTEHSVYATSVVGCRLVVTPNVLMTDFLSQL